VCQAIDLFGPERIASNPVFDVSTLRAFEGSLFGTIRLRDSLGQVHTQRGRSMGESKLSLEDEVMRLTLIRREPNTLRHRQMARVISEPKSCSVFRLSDTGHNCEGILFSKPGTRFHAESFVARSLASEASA
jgi:hypothetical protein